MLCNKVTQFVMRLSNVEALVTGLFTFSFVLVLLVFYLYLRFKVRIIDDQERDVSIIQSILTILFTFQYKSWNPPQKTHWKQTNVRSIAIVLLMFTILALINLLLSHNFISLIDVGNTDGIFSHALAFSPDNSGSTLIIDLLFISDKFQYFRLLNS